MRWYHFHGHNILRIRKNDDHYSLHNFIGRSESLLGWYGDAAAAAAAAKSLFGEEIPELQGWNRL